MTLEERLALRRIIEAGKCVTTSGPTYDENLRQTSSGDPPELHNDKNYQLAWQRCSANFEQMLSKLASANGNRAVRRIADHIKDPVGARKQ
jgi:hypothetical protein